MQKENKITIFVDEQLKEIMPFFFQETQKDFEKIKAAIERRDFIFIVRMAHTIKGECGGYGFPALGDLAKNLENSAQNELLDESKFYLNKMNEYLKSISIEYKKVN